MPRLIVLADDVVCEAQFTRGTSVREILEREGLRVRSGCMGNGACGLCLVKIEAGGVDGLTKNERLLLSREQIDDGLRMACQVIPEDDLSIRVVRTGSEHNWRNLPAENLSPSSLTSVAGGEASGEGYGLAVDLGTTHISITLWDLKQGNRIFGRIGPNPQYGYGADVVTRLTAASESREAAGRMARVLRDAIFRALHDMCAGGGISPTDITRVSIVGNTPMLALLTEKDPAKLLQPRFWTEPVSCALDESRAFAEALGVLPEAEIEVVPPFAGFVGSDLMAGVLATGLTGPPNGLLIDFGTNAEIALWDGNRLWVTSAACGPAFEGCGTQCGLPAEAGAIYRIDRLPGAAGFDLKVIGGGKARGICGSGMVDLIACLRSTGDLTLTGKFNRGEAVDGFIVDLERPDIRLNKGDVDMFQRAKAAIAVGIKSLFASADMTIGEIGRVCVCGAFGQHLDIRNAQRIGLLPEIEPERIELCGNTALSGCEYLLTSPAENEKIDLLRESAIIVNLGLSDDFEELFFENLYLQPMKVDRG